MYLLLNLSRYLKAYALRGTISRRLDVLSSASLTVNPRSITLLSNSTFQREILRSIFTESFIPGILRIVSYTLVTSFVVSIQKIYLVNNSWSKVSVHVMSIIIKI